MMRHARFVKTLALAWGLAAAALGMAGAAGAAGTAAEDAARDLARTLLAPARQNLASAAAFGAKGDLSRAWRALESDLDRWEARLRAAPDSAQAGVFAADLRGLELRSARLIATAEFVHGLKRQGRGWEAVAERWDLDLSSLARAAGVRLDPALGGAAMTRALLDSLGASRRRCRFLADSLAVRWRVAETEWREELAGRDSSLADLRRQLAEAQRTLWEQELRAGRAEADRALVESRLRRQREREQTVRRLSAEFQAGGGDIVLTPQGEVVLRWPALAFAPGESALDKAMTPHLERLAAAVGAFPRGGLRVEGHTDDTGTRAANLALSQARADAVAAWLRERLRLPAGAISAVGLGPDRPLSSNATAAGRARNRRIEVVVLPVAEDVP